MTRLAPPLLQVDALERRFVSGRRGLLRRSEVLHAVRGVSLTIAAGETLGVVGESGCGKSTLARMIVGLDAPSGGQILFEGLEQNAANRRSRGEQTRPMQYVFQDPVASLNPRHTVRQILNAPLQRLLRLDAETRNQRMTELLAAVALPATTLDRYPHEFSGGQSQRISIARALAAEPRLIVLDEPVSALDVSVQAQVLSLLAELRKQFGLTYLFISHDLALVEQVSDRIAVMYFGRIVEQGPVAEVFAAPRHPYTRLLLDAAPRPGRRIETYSADTAELPDPHSPPAGCAFAARCSRRQLKCTHEDPNLTSCNASDQKIACFNPLPSNTSSLRTA